MTRKQAYTEYLSRIDGLRFSAFANYSNLPRKLKKDLKRYAEKFLHYDRKRKRVTFFNPQLLSVPTPRFTFMQDMKPLPLGERIKFRRFKDGH